MMTACWSKGVPSSKYFDYYRVLTWLVFQSECSLALLVDVTFWCILVPSSDEPLAFLNYGSVSMHILNALFILIDLFLNDIPVHFHFGAFTLIPALLYVLWSWLYFALSGEWDYFFVDPSKVIDAVWMILVFFMHVMSWCAVWKMAGYKQRSHPQDRQRKLLSVNDGSTETEVDSEKQ